MTWENSLEEVRRFHLHKDILQEKWLSLCWERSFHMLLLIHMSVKVTAKPTAGPLFSEVDWTMVLNNFKFQVYY